MAASTTALLDRLDQLVTQFNRGSLDLPDGFLDRNAGFRLNGVAYEETMGRAADDPLVRLVARGPGAYRFLAKALRYALPDATVTLGSLERQPTATGLTLGGPARLAGTPRSDTALLQSEASVVLHFDPDARLIGVDVAMDDHAVRTIQRARAGEAPR